MAKNYQWPRECPLPGHGFDLCDGPTDLGTADDWSTRWAVWIATEGIRFGKWEAGQVMDDELGDVNPHYTANERPSHVTMTFSRAGQPIIAIQSDATTVSLRYFVDDTSTEVTFTGKTPLLFNNQAAFQAADPSDRAVLYIKDDGDQIYCRFEAEDWGTEHTINAGLNGNLRELLKTDVISITDDSDESVHWYQALWAINQAGKVVYFRSAEYVAAVIDVSSLMIEDYFDGMFPRLVDPEDPDRAVWDGKFTFYGDEDSGRPGWSAAPDTQHYFVTGRRACRMVIVPVDPDDDFPEGGFILAIGSDTLFEPSNLWSGNLQGSSPVGTYVNNGSSGINPTDPATVTIIEIDDAITINPDFSGSCFS